MDNDWTSGDLQDWYFTFWLHYNIFFRIFFLVLLNFFIVLVMTNIGSRLCCDMYRVIFSMSSSVNIDYLYAFGRCCLSVLYKMEAIIQYYATDFPNLLGKVSASAIMFYFGAQ